MKYALRLTRELCSDYVEVHPIIQVRNGAKPFSVKNKKYFESLQIFDTLKEARRAERNEKIAAKFALKSPEELYAIVTQDADTMRDLGFSLSQMCDIAQVSYQTVMGYTSKQKKPTPRTIAKLHIITLILKGVRDTIISTLPADGGVGNPSLGRYLRN